MKVLIKAIWIVLALAAAFSVAVVVRIINPAEKVNALWIVTASACFYVLMYRFYGAFLAAKVLCLDSRNRTPAIRLQDGADFDPTNKWVLFGHHFAAIAGAGPLIGPMLAVQFGYLPGFLWILVGAAMAGAVHDMVILAASVRRNGRSLARIAADEIGPVGGLATSIAVIFIIIVALAGLGLSVVNALRNNPWSTYTIFLTIPIALLMGLYLRKIRPGRVGEVSLLGVPLLLAAVASGHFIPGSFLAPLFNHGDKAIIIALAAYGFLASVLPVWMLLCPRDYLSTYMKIGTVLLLALGVLFMAPVLQMPALTPFVHGGGPVIPGTLFPFMFITIACGAISGFHALIASGTTPKMITSEGQVRFIGYGAMLTEGFVSMMALIAASILIPGDYFAINSTWGFDRLASVGFPVARIHELSALVGVNVAHRPGGAVSLAVGMSTILSHIPGMKSLMPYWFNFALVFEALFILTTVDAGTRVARFLLQELGGRVYRPLGELRWLPGNLAMSAVVVVAWGYLIYTGSVATIWPMFGVANQLLAAIALGIGTTIILKAGLAKYAWVTLVPMCFMFATTLTAAWKLAAIFGAGAFSAPTASAAFTFRLDALLVLCMAFLAVVTLTDMLHKWWGWYTGERAITTSEVVDYPVRLIPVKEKVAISTTSR
jgi:carbon starvation protein